MSRDRLRIFTGNAHPRLAHDICSHLGVPLGEATCRRFPDGEIDLKVECDVRGADVFIVQYWREIAESVIDQMRPLAVAKSLADGKKIWFGVIDGFDSNRIHQGYSAKF